MKAIQKDEEVGKRAGNQTISVCRWYYYTYGKWKTMPKSIRNYIVTKSYKIQNSICKVTVFLYTNNFFEKNNEKFYLQWVQD